MISSIFNLAVYNPLYNGIVFLMDIIPWADLGIVVIIFTLIIRLILFPLSKKSVQTQLKIKEIEPAIDEIKTKYKDNKEKQAKETMALYKKEGINPFSGILFLFVQIPIIFGLYFIFIRGGFPVIDTHLLYSFISVPEKINITFLNIVDLTEKSMALSLLAGITQFIQAKLLSSKMSSPKKGSFQGDFAKTMQLQMKYVFPVIITFIAYSLSAMIALYWTTSNLFTIGQEWYLKRKFKKE
jgi:YidC/Oxa1 family membrane protein insertase